MTDTRQRPGDQAPPTRNDGPIIQDLVRADVLSDRIVGPDAVRECLVNDLTARLRVGIERYGTGLQPHNGRDALRDAYEEALDLATYLRQVQEEGSDGGVEWLYQQAVRIAYAVRHRIAARDGIWMSLSERVSLLGLVVVREVLDETQRRVEERFEQAMDGAGVECREGRPSARRIGWVRVYEPEGGPCYEERVEALDDADIIEIRIGALTHPKTPERVYTSDVG